MTHTLMPNKQAPELSLSLVGGGDWCLSKQEPENFTMIIFYRGLHCPVCKSYLGKLNAMMNDILDLCKNDFDSNVQNGEKNYSFSEKKNKITNTKN